MDKNINLEIINEQIDEENKEVFVIDSDEKAEWTLKKIAEERAESQRYISVCKAMIEEYQGKIAKMEEKTKNKLSFLEFKLQDYFLSVEHKVTKTQETYKLPSGTLKLKYQKPDFKRDDEALIKWLKENNLNDFVKVEEKTNWGDLKKKINVSGSNALTEDGEIIEGIEVVEKEPIFKVET